MTYRCEDGDCGGLVCMCSDCWDRRVWSLHYDPNRVDASQRAQYANAYDPNWELLNVAAMSQQELQTRVTAMYGQLIDDLARRL